MTDSTPTLILENLQIVDVVAGEILENRRVVVEAGLIKSIEGDTPSLEGAQRLDLGGAFLLPGLIDAHVHVTAFANDFAQLAQSSPYYVASMAASEMQRMLMRGFTSVRDVGGADFGLARAVEEGVIDGPRLFYCGKALSQTGGHGDMRVPGVEALDPAYSQPGLGVVCDGVPEVRRAARAELRRGAHHVKIMGGGGAASPTDRLDSDQFSEEEIRAVVEEASMANRYVAVHAYASRTIERATRLGVRSVEHGNYLDEATAALMLQRGTYLVPTLVAYHETARHGAALGLATSTMDKIMALVEPGLRAVELAHRTGIPMAYGTDLVGHFLQRCQLNEFRIRREVLAPVELIRSATCVGAALLQREEALGQVAVGYVADLIAVKSNPLDDITVLCDPEPNLVLVMKRGRLFKTPAR